MFDLNGLWGDIAENRSRLFCDDLHYTFNHTHSSKSGNKYTRIKKHLSGIAPIMVYIMALFVCYIWKNLVKITQYFLKKESEINAK